MISNHNLNNPSSYAFVAGCWNATWLVGYAMDYSREDKTVLLSREHPGQQSRENAMEVSFPNDQIPSSLQQGDTVKVIAHLYSGVTEEMDDKEAVKAGRHVRMEGVYLGRPGILDTEPDTSAELEASNAIAMPETFTRASNHFELAGFVAGEPFQMDKRVIFLLQQANSRESLIPIEMSGKQGIRFRKAIRVGSPVFVEGLMEPVQRGGEVQTVARATNLRRVEPARDFTFSSVPGWVVDIRRRYLSRSAG